MSFYFVTCDRLYEIFLNLILNYVIIVKKEVRFTLYFTPQILKLSRVVQ